MIWFFGDSFSVMRIEGMADHPYWTEIVSQMLNFDTFYNYSNWGVSNEWILNELITKQNQFEVGDKVVVQLTSPDRQWFFEDNPTLGNFYVNDFSSIKELTKQQKNAVKSYITYLNSKHLTSIRGSLYHLAIERITQLLDFVHILILPSWNSIPSINGVLVDVSNEEFVSKKARMQWYKKHQVDIRANHLSEENHEILANKIVEYFNTGNPIDLKTGFKQRFLE